jgi:hypothetical protein
VGSHRIVTPIDLLAPEPLRSTLGVATAASVALVRLVIGGATARLAGGDDGSAWEPFLPEAGAEP